MSPTAFCQHQLAAAWQKTAAAAAEASDATPRQPPAIAGQVPELVQLDLDAGQVPELVQLDPDAGQVPELVQLDPDAAGRRVAGRSSGTEGHAEPERGNVDRLGPLSRLAAGCRLRSKLAPPAPDRNRAATQPGVKA
jgi:hypothetical protein